MRVRASFSLYRFVLRNDLTPRRTKTMSNLYRWLRDWLYAIADASYEKPGRTR